MIIPRPNIENSVKRAALAACCSLLVSCSGGIPPATSPVQPAEVAQRTGTSQTLVAFSPNGNASIAAYPASSSGAQKPRWLLRGSKTLLGFGNSAAVDEGTVYAIAGSPLTVLEFKSGSNGNVAPAHTIALPKNLLSGYVVGFALDGAGNFFISDGPDSKVLRFPLTTATSANPNGAFQPVMATPDGPLRARPANVAVGPGGTLYVLCSVVKNGNVAHGVSEYTVDAAGHATLVRSFYDLTLPEAPPASIAVDRKGTVYLAGGLSTSPIFAYAANNQSGGVVPSRVIGGSIVHGVSSIALDDAGELYVAVQGRIAVFAADANGMTKPLRSIVDSSDLQYGDGAYGTLLALTHSFGASPR